MQRSIDPRADAAALRRLFVILRRERFDIIHLHSSKAGFLGRLAARASGSRAAVIYSPHGLAFLGAGGRARRRLFLALERLAGRLADRIVAVSPGERAIILAAGLAGPEQVVCIPNGIAPPALPAAYDRAGLRRALGQPSDAPLIGTAARLAPQKNPRFFLDAAARVLRQLPAARFVWCGSGELADAARAYARQLGIDQMCKFIGHRDDAQQIIAALDIFWLTSDYEGLPLAPLEAMALGVPIVATDVVGTRDLLRTGAGLLAPQQAEIFADATVRLARRTDRRAQLGRAGQAYFSDNGTSERMLDAMAQLYQAVAARTPGPSARPEQAAALIG